MPWRFPGLLLVAAAALGCASAGALPPGLLTPATVAEDAPLVTTTTQLSRANYRVRHAGVTGESRGFVLLLFFNVVSPSLNEAMDRLYTAAGLAPGPAWALANVVVERQARSFLLFALPRVRVRADVVEFVPGPRRSRADADRAGPDPGADPPDTDPKRPR